MCAAVHIFGSDVLDALKNKQENVCHHPFVPFDNSAVDLYDGLSHV